MATDFRNSRAGKLILLRCMLLCGSNKNKQFVALASN
jgi:hypothetical protein